MTTPLLLWYIGLGCVTFGYILHDLRRDADREYDLGLRDHALSPWVGVAHDLCIIGALLVLPLALWLHFSGA